jgi:hypothetical protein
MYIEATLLISKTTRSPRSEGFYNIADSAALKRNRDQKVPDPANVIVAVP